MTEKSLSQTITPEVAEIIARARAVMLGWGIVEPLTVSKRRSWTGKIRSYNVDSNPARRGTKVRFAIDAETGIILSEGYLPHLKRGFWRISTKAP